MGALNANILAIEDARGTILGYRVEVYNRSAHHGGWSEHWSAQDMGAVAESLSVMGVGSFKSDFNPHTLEQLRTAAGAKRVKVHVDSRGTWRQACQQDLYARMLNGTETTALKQLIYS